MKNEVVVSILKALSYFFFNPLFILAILVALAVGYYRVKNERKSFRVRILPGITEVQNLLKDSWLYGILLSILIVGIGHIVDTGWLLVFVAWMTIGLLMMNFKFLSPVYFSFLAWISLYVLSKWQPDFTYLDWSIADVDFLGPLTVTIPIITGLLLIVEGLLIFQHGGENASTYLIRTQRGLRAGVFKSKKLWLLPTLFLVPGDMIGAYLPYWPQYSLGTWEFSFIPVPLVIGFSQVFRTNYPQIVSSQIGRAIVFTGWVVTVVGIVALWIPIVGWAALIAGVAARIVISSVISFRERKGQFVLGQRKEGLVIAGILPDSPSEKMGLLPGEVIRSVNGQQVHTEKELYDAIQLNAAHCRLQVIDRNGEVRLMQSVLYHHDHHRLGILAVQ